MQASKIVISYKLIRGILILISLIAQLALTKSTRQAVITDSCDNDERRFGNHTKSNRIVDGEETDIDDFPNHVVLNIYKARINKKVTCGGVILERFMVLTAAHCLRDVLDPGDILVLNTNLSPKFWSEEERRRAVKVAKFCIHSSYWNLNGKSWYDFAILRLRWHLKNFKTGEMSTVGVDEDDIVTAVGVGISHYDSEDRKKCEWPFKLKRLDMKLAECDEFDDGDSHVCFKSKDSGGVCFGDSGSPVYDEDGDVVALTSYGQASESCIHNMRATSVFADVVAMRSEIEDLIDSCRVSKPDPSEGSGWWDLS